MKSHKHKGTLVQARKAEKVNPQQARTCVQVMGVQSLDTQKCGSRGMGPTTRLENHGCEVTWVWHDGPRRSHGKCHARHVDVRT